MVRLTHLVTPKSPRQRKQNVMGSGLERALQMSESPVFKVHAPYMLVLSKAFTLGIFIILLLVVSSINQLIFSHIK